MSATNGFIGASTGAIVAALYTYNASEERDRFSIVPSVGFGLISGFFFGVIGGKSGAIIGVKSVAITSVAITSAAGSIVGGVVGGLISGMQVENIAKKQNKIIT